MIFWFTKPIETGLQAMQYLSIIQAGRKPRFATDRLGFGISYLLEHEA